MYIAASSSNIERVLQSTTLFGAFITSFSSIMNFNQKEKKNTKRNRRKNY